MKTTILPSVDQQGSLSLAALGRHNNRQVSRAGTIPECMSRSCTIKVCESLSKTWVCPIRKHWNIQLISISIHLFFNHLADDLRLWPARAPVHCHLHRIAGE